MSVEELQQAIRRQIGEHVFTRLSGGVGKTTIECGVIIPWTDQQKGYTRSIIFNAASIPADAVAKVEAAINR